MPDSAAFRVAALVREMPAGIGLYSFSNISAKALYSAAPKTYNYSLY
jgi:hypothetical protein